MPEPLYSRVLLKLSGEVLAGEKGFGIDPKKAKYLAKQIAAVKKLKIDIGLIIGAGNIFRGIQAAGKGMDRVTGDYLGMLATIMNAIAVQDALEKEGCEIRTLSAISVDQIAEPYIRRRAIRHLEKNRIIIVAGGTGNPFFTTDSAAALRATELGAEVVLKGTKVNGVYNKDPMVHPDATRYDSITFSKVIQDDIRVMDLTAVTLCKENNLPIRVFNINNPGDLIDVLLDSKIGTTVYG
ncbi:uncharacterized protein METZ01_LOCUS123727 [marine metagenome]|uniref:Uridylate kinase n=1 Tax=marine metagenome TaxID=408172 RepID=A0A381Y305_9ZZZZ